MLKEQLVFQLWGKKNLVSTWLKSAEDNIPFIKDNTTLCITSLSQADMLFRKTKSRFNAYLFHSEANNMNRIHKLPFS